MSEKKFSVVVTHSGSRPVGDEIGRNHAFFMLAHWVSGKPVDDLEPGECCIFQAHTADGRRQVGKKQEWIQYSVGRVS